MLSATIITLASYVLSVSATCYFPSGGISSLDVACNPSASDSACCFHDQACLSNGLCLTGVVDGINQYARGTCTDPNWQSGACPNFCLDQQSLGNAMFSCNITGQDEYCCNEGCDCSKNGINQIVSFTATPYTLTIIAQTGTYPNPSATPSTSSSSFAATTTSTTSSTIPTAQSTSPSSSSSSSSSSNSTAIGVGVGVGVGVGIFLGAGTFFFCYRRKRTQARHSHLSDKEKSTPPAYWHQGGYIPKTPYAHPAADRSAVSELGQSVTDRRVELPGSGNRAELAAH